METKCKTIFLASDEVLAVKGKDYFDDIPLGLIKENTNKYFDGIYCDYIFDQETKEHLYFLGVSPEDYSPYNPITWQ